MKDTDKLKQLIEQEKELRDKWRRAVAELNSLIEPIHEHLKESRSWWTENVRSQDEIIVIGGSESYKIKKPDMSDVSYETHLPHGIDFENIEVIKID